MNLGTQEINVIFHMETSHLTCCVNQTAGFNMKCNTGLKYVKEMLWVVQMLGFTLW